MISMVKKTLKSRRKGKKKWFQVLSPKIFNNIPIGETFQYDLRDALGSTVETNLMNLTRNIKNQNISVKFLINNVKNTQLYTEIISYTLNNSSLKRMVRRRRGRIDDSLILKTKDNIDVRIKPILITRSRTKGSIKQALRKKVKELITNFLRKNDYETVFKNVVFYSLQKELKEKLDKIYPLSNCEIRVLKREQIIKKSKEKEKPEKEKEVRELKEKKAKEEKKEEVSKEEKPEPKKQEKPEKKETSKEKKETKKKQDKQKNNNDKPKKDEGDKNAKTNN
jgi:ribosomal protein S3AE